MPITKKHIEICAKMYECQDSMKKLFGDEKYQVKIVKYAKVLRDYATDHGLDTLSAVLQICSNPDFNAMSIAMFMAAAVEMIEGKA